MNINKMIAAQDFLSVYRLKVSEKEGACYIHNKIGQVVIKVKTDEELHAFIKGVKFLG